MKLVLFEIEDIFNSQSVTKSPCVKCDMKSDKHGTSVASVNNAQIKTWAERKNELFEFLNFSNEDFIIIIGIDSSFCFLI